MRADRLLSMLLILQTHGKQTARQLASQLEVSERTVYRDVLALNTAGIPIYTEDGPGGGISLVEEYSTSLTGLNVDEVQALAMLTIPEPLVRLGVAPNLKVAMLKLSAAIPGAAREAEQRIRERIHLDPTSWRQDGETPPTLHLLYQAVLEDHQVHVFLHGDFDTLLEQHISPYGLVAKANTWHLVYLYLGKLRVRQVSSFEKVHILLQTFFRPRDFDLVAFWDEWCAVNESGRTVYPVKARVSPALAVSLARRRAGEHPLPLPAPPGLSGDGWQEVSLEYENFDEARTAILGYGGAIEVLEPLALRLSVADYARQVLKIYV
jgi:predicted DNA-binding transcriptional regulator YafY